MSTKSIKLATKIAEELGTSRLQPVILVGVGNLGLALLSYRGFEKEGFEIIAAFEHNRLVSLRCLNPLRTCSPLAAFRPRRSSASTPW